MKKRINKKALLAAIRQTGSLALKVVEGDVVLCDLKYLKGLVKKAAKNENQLAMLFIPRSQ